MTRLTTTPPVDEPTIVFSLVETGSGDIHVVAKHSHDAADQRIAIIHANADGAIVMELRRIYAPSLTAALHVRPDDPILTPVEMPRNLT